MGLLLDEIGHGLAYLTVGLYVFFALKKLYSHKGLIIGLLTTYAIDADHLYDYFLDVGFSFDIKRFFSGGYFDANQQVFVLFHSWEIATLIFVTFLFLKNKVKYNWLFFVFIAFAVHLTYDIASYGFDYKVYFLSYRLLNNFNINIFLN